MRRNMEKILVTGGCGFIGANLVKKLYDRNYKISIFDNFSKGDTRYLDDSKKYAIIEGDIRDLDALTLAMNGIDKVVHLAAFGSVVESVQDPSQNFDINAFGTFNVLKAAKNANIKKVVFASTGGALIGNATPPVDENSIPRPISPYGASKLVGEGYCCAFANSYDMSIVALRFANVIGPISWHKKGAVTAFFKNIMNGKPLVIFGDGCATRDFLYVDDLCNGIIAAIETPKKGFNVYHIASGREVSIKELAEISCNIAGVESKNIIYKGKRAGEVERNFAHYSLAKKELGFEPKYSLESALRETWDWFVKNNS